MKLISTTTKENFNIAFNAIRSQFLRAVLTMSIIAIGITALVGMITAIEAIQKKISSEFTRLGSNTFTIRSGSGGMGGGRHGQREKFYEPISYNQANQFVDEFSTDGLISMSAFAGGAMVLKFENKKTNPNVTVVGIDEHYLQLSSYELDLGRNFSAGEIERGLNVVILGADIVDDLFGQTLDPMGKQIRLAGNSYTVVGTLKKKGNTFGFASDNQCAIPVGNVRKQFETASTDYTINVMLNNAGAMKESVSDAKGIMRLLRNDDINSEESFEIRMSDSLVEELNGMISGITMGGILISIITLLGASIGLMNIMLVSVTERTREIGTRKALGATPSNVRNQFLIESIVIGQLGGVMGIIMGILVGNVVAYFVETSFVIPWKWLILGVTICFIVSVVSGYYPARKASKLDPIDALRYE